MKNLEHSSALPADMTPELEVLGVIPQEQTLGVNEAGSQKTVKVTDYETPFAVDDLMEIIDTDRYEPGHFATSSLTGVPPDDIGDETKKK